MDLTDDTDYQNLLERISQTYTEGQKRAYQAVNVQLTETYWKIGHDIVEYEQGGKARADYGTALLDHLSRDLTLRHGKGFSRSNLIRFRQVYQVYPIRATLSHELSRHYSYPQQRRTAGRICHVPDEQSTFCPEISTLPSRLGGAAPPTGIHPEGSGRGREK
jgi:hypothetical protein